MDEKIIQPPFYNSGFYNTGSGGGGGGGGGATQFSSIFFSQQMSLNLPQTLEKSNLCIVCSFVKISNSMTLLELYNGSNANGYVRIGSNGALIVNNETASYSSDLAINSYDQSVIIREGGYRRFESDSIYNNWCPYQNNNIDKIKINSLIKRIAFYYGAINDFAQDNKIIDFRPCIEEGQNGFKDIVSGNFYPLSNCNT